MAKTIRKGGGVVVRVGVRDRDTAEAKEGATGYGRRGRRDSVLAVPLSVNVGSESMQMPGVESGARFMVKTSVCPANCIGLTIRSMCGNLRGADGKIICPPRLV